MWNTNENERKGETLDNYPKNDRPYAYGTVKSEHRNSTAFLNNCAFDPLTASSHWVAWLRSDNQVVLYDRRQDHWMPTTAWWLNEVHRFQSQHNPSVVVNGDHPFCEEVNVYVSTTTETTEQQKQSNVTTHNQPSLKINVTNDAPNVRVLQLKMSPIIPNLIAIITSHYKLIVLEFDDQCRPDNQTSMLL
ncbi:hypothetical protein RFI_39133 [Reticulomyxa filosa]|nr:hypothetical protein RFI_39133 [Reticulomyxa filosa]|eukprot:ETN98377.1 hypothetical protein RFI_39133 [Reticulomyxa filosa]